LRVRGRRDHQGERDGYRECGRYPPGKIRPYRLPYP
jgi:hypothetical protein